MDLDLKMLIAHNTLFAGAVHIVPRFTSTQMKSNGLTAPFISLVIVKAKVKGQERKKTQFKGWGLWQESK